MIDKRPAEKKAKARPRRTTWQPPSKTIERDPRARRSDSKSTQEKDAPFSWSRIQVPKRQKEGKRNKIQTNSERPGLRGTGARSPERPGVPAPESPTCRAESQGGDRPGRVDISASSSKRKAFAPVGTYARYAVGIEKRTNWGRAPLGGGSQRPRHHPMQRDAWKAVLS